MTTATIDGVTVTTNNVPRDIVHDFELTPPERERFDFLDWAAIEDGRDSAAFFRYRGELEYLGDFMRWDALSCSPTPHWLDGWDGYAPDSFFSGLVVRYATNDDGDECVIVGRYVSCQS